MNENLKYCVDAFGKGYRAFLNHTKMTLLLFKLLLFSTFAAYFTYNYFITFESTADKTNFTLQPTDTPISSIILMGIVACVFVIADVIEITSRRRAITKIILDDKVPHSIKKIFAEKLTN